MDGGSFMDKSKVLQMAGKELAKLAKNKKVQKIVLGTYTNGKPRSLVDAVNNELLSPEDRLLIEERIEEIRKKKKGKKKSKKKDKKKDKKKKSKKKKKNSDIFRSSYYEDEDLY